MRVISRPTCSLTCPECRYCPCTFGGAFCFSHGLIFCFCDFNYCLHYGLDHDLLVFHFLPVFRICLSETALIESALLGLFLFYFSHHVILLTLKEDNTMHWLLLSMSFITIYLIMCKDLVICTPYATYFMCAMHQWQYYVSMYATGWL